MINKEQMDDTRKELASAYEKKPLLDFIDSCLDIIYDTRASVSDKGIFGMVDEFIKKYEGGKDE